MQMLTNKKYKVSVSATIFVEANSLQEAKDMGHDAVIGCDIKTRDFDIDAEEWGEADV